MTHNVFLNTKLYVKIFHLVCLFLWKYFLCNQLKIVFFSFVILSVINLIFWVRNWYGILWLTLFITALVCSFLYLPLFYHRYVLLFFIF